jgi:hypothetical protein
MLPLADDAQADACHPVPTVSHIGTTSPAYALDVRNGQVAGAGAYVNSSDDRMKTAIQELPYCLRDVLKLRPVAFQWNKPFPHEEGRRIGLIAQEVELVIPEVVSTTDDGDKSRSLAYGSLVPVLVKAVQQLNADNDNEARLITELEADNDNLRHDIEELRREVNSR